MTLVLRLAKVALSARCLGDCLRTVMVVSDPVN